MEVKETNKENSKSYAGLNLTRSTHSLCFRVAPRRERTNMWVLWTGRPPRTVLLTCGAPRAVASRHTVLRRLSRLRMGSSHETRSPYRGGHCDIAAHMTEELRIGTIRTLRGKS
jgi:hypothetical protein